jgi:hypothetical protein
VPPLHSQDGMQRLSISIRRFLYLLVMRHLRTSKHRHHFLDSRFQDTTTVFFYCFSVEPVRSFIDHEYAPNCRSQTPQTKDTHRTEGKVGSAYISGYRIIRLGETRRRIRIVQRSGYVSMGRCMFCKNAFLAVLWIISYKMPIPFSESDEGLMISSLSAKGSLATTQFAEISE